MPPKLDLRIVRWIDSSAAHGWLDNRDGVVKDLNCISVGFLVKKTKTSITLARDKSADYHGDFITIPMCAVTDIKKLKP